MNFTDILKTVSKVAPTIGSIVTNPIGGGIALLCDLIGVATADEAKEKIKTMPIDHLLELEKKMQMELEMRKIDLEQNKLKHVETMNVFQDKRQARELFAHNKEIIRFGANGNFWNDNNSLFHLQKFAYRRPTFAFCSRSESFYRRFGLNACNAILLRQCSQKLKFYLFSKYNF